MPEVSIGHIPDVGASYFLSRLPGHFGIILTSFFYYATLQLFLFALFDIKKKFDGALSTTQNNAIHCLMK